LGLVSNGRNRVEIVQPESTRNAERKGNYFQNFKNLAMVSSRDPT
jgi:hypothetical protein